MSDHLAQSRIWVLVSLLIAAVLGCGSDSKPDEARYLAVGGGGVMYYSSDAVTWSPATSGTVTTDVNAVAWNGSVYAAVGSGGVLLFSANGKDWNGNVYTGLNTLTGIAAHDGVFCAAGDSGLLLRSPDNGVTWESHGTPSVTQYLSAIVWTGSRFCAVGNDGVTATSPDCISWTKKTSAPVSLLDVIAMGTRIVALGSNGKLYYSDDNGTSWNERTIGGAVVLWSALATNGTELLVAGFHNTGGPEITSTTNLTDWTGVWSDSSNDHALYGLHWDGSRFLAVGTKGTLVVSSDAAGSSWSLRTVATTNQSIHGIAHR